MGRRGPHGGPYAVGDEEAGRVITARQRAEDARLDALVADGRLRAAAIVAHTFHLDPAQVLGEGDAFKRLVRIAAHNVIQTQANKRN